VNELSTQPVVETIDLSKTYDSKTAVDRLNLRIEEGEIFGFLGPNGAGKTTTILMLLGLTEPTSGVARICGYNSTREPLKVKRLAGYVPEKVGFYEDLTAGYNLAYTARLNGFPDELIQRRIGEALEVVGLSQLAGQKVGTFSRGMKQRLAIADILIKMPRIAFLDEPTASIDPMGITQILDMIATISRDRHMTIIISSHQLPQIQRICSRIGIISKGRVVVEGRLDQLGRRAPGDGQFRIEVQLVETTSAIIDRIKQIEGVVGVERADGRLLINCRQDVRPQIAKAIVEADGLLMQMNLQSFALEDIYREYFTGG
jgi:ABC-2 type transport system ATP-binding protein